MATESDHEKKSGSDTSTKLAYERTFLAHERTLMAWLRTGLSLISFGFGIAKFFQYLHEQKGITPPVFGPKTVGILMILIGIAGLSAATVQHRQAIKMLRVECPGLPASVSGTLATLVSFLGILALVGALLRH